MFVYTVYCEPTDYQPGQLSDPIFSIFIIINNQGNFLKPAAPFWLGCSLQSNYFLKLKVQNVVKKKNQVAENLNAHCCTKVEVSIYIYFRSITVPVKW